MLRKLRDPQAAAARAADREARAEASRQHLARAILRTFEVDVPRARPPARDAAPRAPRDR